MLIALISLVTFHNSTVTTHLVEFSVRMIKFYYEKYF